MRPGNTWVSGLKLTPKKSRWGRVRFRISKGTIIWGFIFHNIRSKNISFKSNTTRPYEEVVYFYTKSIEHCVISPLDDKQILYEIKIEDCKITEIKDLRGNPQNTKI